MALEWRAQGRQADLRPGVQGKKGRGGRFCQLKELTRRPRTRGWGGKPHPTGAHSQLGDGSHWHREAGATPGRGLQGADGPRDAGAGRGRAQPRSPPQPQARAPRPPVRPAPAAGAAMCAARMPPLAHIFRGTFVHSTRTCPMEVLRDHLLGVSDGGKIVFLEEASQQEKLAKEWCFKPCEVRELSHHEFFMPGLVDTHIHAPQYYFAGSNVDLPLLEWLTNYTFPVEQRFKNIDFAEEVYTRVVRRTLKNGTTTACYFGTIHTDSSLLLAEITDKFGQRAFVGKVCMDLNDTVPEYKETTEESVKETERFVLEMLQRNYSRVKPIVTPRFSLSCTETLMSELGNIAKTHDLHIQSHISENRDEVEAVKNLYPNYKNYTDVYDKNNLLTNKTVMAHGCYLSAEELNIFSERGASIAHCPNSNLSLSSGFLNVLEVLKHEVKIGLGTDVAGGYSSSMLDAIRRAVMVSNILLINKVNEKSLTLKEVFRLATLGGSQALGLDSEIGNFEVGKEFDALLINPKASDSPIDLFYGDFVGDISEAVIQKFLYLGDDRNIEEVYVGGKQVVPFSSSV